MNLFLTHIDGRELKHETLRLCKEFLGSPWNEVSISDFQFSIVSGGLCNALYSCSLPETIKIDNPKTPKKVLLRFYGPIQENEHATLVETTTFMLLSERHMGPKLYGIFPKGRLEEFIPSRSMNNDDVRQRSTDIARDVAKIHALDVPARKIPSLYQITLENFLGNVDRDTMKTLGRKFSLRELYRKEIDWMVKEMEQVKSPIVYCHNDLQGGNILIREDSFNGKKPNIMLIDYEFSCYNYRGYDIASHFCEWAFEYNTPEPPHYIFNPDKYPTKEEQVEFITAYLNQLVVEGCLKATEVSIETGKILEELKIFSLAAHLFWSLWGHKMKFTSDSDFCHKTHSEERRGLYDTLKEKYLT